MSALLPPVTLAVEGPTDEAVLRRVLDDLCVPVGPVHIKRGKQRLREQVQAYNNAARLAPWIVLADLDHDAGCAPLLVAEWLPEPSKGMRLRVAVHQVEAWLLGDRDGLARFLRVERDRIPRDPELLLDAKQTIVDLSTLSRSKDIRHDMVPAHGSRARVGPGYTSRLMEFAYRYWNIERAAEACTSLRHCMLAVQLLSSTWTQ